jgi:hypothetical protein
MLRESQETPLEASKWLAVQALLEDSEAAALLHALGDVKLAISGSICSKGEEFLSTEQFLTHYSAYVQKIKESQEFDPAQFRKWFSLLLTRSMDALFAVPIGDTQCLVRCCQPVVVVQMHQFTYSTLDKKFRSMAFGTESIPWGVQFSFPQLYRDRKTNEVHKVSSQNENAQLYHALQKWMRLNTIPTPFYVEETRHNVPIRLGKLCLSWINQHPWLIKKGIKVL